MQNPFETGHIKNYIVLYVSVVVIMILFFIASTLFNDIQKIDKKFFDDNVSEIPKGMKVMKNIQEVNASRFKLMDKAY